MFDDPVTNDLPLKLEVRAYVAADEPAVIDLWTRCGLVVPHNNPHTDIQRKLSMSPELFLVGTLGGDVVATAMVGYDGHRGWVNYLAVAPHLQKHGYGRVMMERAEALLRQCGCPKLNVQIRATNEHVIEFYQQLGFAREGVVSMGKRLITDEPS